MKTGLIENWTGNPVEIGPIYPLVGFEVHLFVVCLILWIAYTVWQMRFEAEKYLDEVTELSGGDTLEKAVENNRKNH
jgi:hypothetical protein